MSTDGEAANPGPLATFATSNITSMETQYNKALRIPADVLGAQEIRLTEASQLLWARELQESHLNCAFGKGLPETSSATSASQGGVAIISRYPVQRINPSDELGWWLWNATRCVHAVVVINSDVLIHVVCVYGYTNAARDPFQRQQNEALLNCVFAYLTGLGEVPVVLLGDLNTGRHASAMLDSALASGLYWDCAQLISELQGEEPELTCFAKKNSPGTRVDYVIANRTMVQPHVMLSWLTLSFRTCTTLRRRRKQLLARRGES